MHHRSAILIRFPNQLSRSVGKSLFSSATPTFEPSQTQTKENLKYDVSQSKGNLMEAWQIKSFGSIEKLELNIINAPIIKKPNDVLIEVKATSVNPIDVAMAGGYGNVLLQTLRMCAFDSRFEQAVPLILGRDFAGVVIGKGNEVGNEIRIGDNVYGVVVPHLQGCHAEQVVTDASMVSRIPDSMDFKEAAGILYTGLTAWSALQITGDLFLTSAKRKKVLVLGASGGVGTVAVQLLKAWETEVVATCSTEAVPLVMGLKADRVIDYTTKEAIQEICKAGKYDVILDASGRANSTTYTPFLKDWCNSKFITLRSPLLKNTDTHGFIKGMAYNLADIISVNLSSGAPSKGSSVRWGFFMPIPYAVKEISRLVAKKKVKPIVQESFSFKDLPAAYKRVSEGHLRGKVVVLVD